MKTIDLTKKIDIEMVADSKANYQKAEGQDFYKSPSGKMIHLAEKLPNGDWWIVKSWVKSKLLLIG